MNKSIYDEALEIIDNNTFELGKGLDVLKPTYRETVVKALEQAQKQEKLLELYKELSKLKDDVIHSVFFDTEYEHLMVKKVKIEKQIKELEK